MVSLSDREVLSVKIWIVVIGVQIILFPVFLPPLSFLFLCWYSSYAPDQGLQDEANQERLGVEGTWINSKTKIIFEFIYVVVSILIQILLKYSYAAYEAFSLTDTCFMSLLTRNTQMDWLSYYVQLLYDGHTSVN